MIEWIRCREDEEDEPMRLVYRFGEEETWAEATYDGCLELEGSENGIHLCDPVGFGASLPGLFLMAATDWLEEAARRGNPYLSEGWERVAIRMMEEVRDDVGEAVGD